MTRTEIRNAQTQEVIKTFDHEFAKNMNHEYIKKIVTWIENGWIDSPKVAFDVVEIEDGKEISKHSYLPIIG